MHDTLGYTRFAVQGGDWGAFIASRLGYVHPEKLIGIHLNLLALRRDQQDVADPTPEEKAYLRRARGMAQRRDRLPVDTGHQAADARLSRSPTRRRGSRHGSSRSSAPGRIAAGMSKPRFTRDRLLANISLYWFTGAIGSSFWPYYARQAPAVANPRWADHRRPDRVCPLPAEILRPPRSLAERTYTDIRRWSVMPRGGHFAALEQPEALANEVREFFRPLRHP